MKQSTIDKCNEYFKSVRAGEGPGAALKRLNLSSATLHRFKQDGTLKKKVRRKKFIDILSVEQPPNRDLVALVICRPDQIQNVIAGVK